MTPRSSADSSVSLDPIAAWLVEPESHIDSTEALFDGLAARLDAGGLSIVRMSTSVPTKHPEVYVRNVRWERAAPLKVVFRPHTVLATEMYKNSPVAQIHEGAASVRRRLHGAGAVLDFPILEEIAALGATDYFAAALVHGDGDRSYFSWATDADGGFSDEAILRLSRLVPFVGVRIELDSARYTLRSLLEVYLGHNAAARVLSGRFRRGQGETLRCAILFSDMRGFTSLADHASPHDVVATLDAYFEKVAGPISTHGGEVLKFVGDAVLAIFPCHDGDASACARAVEAARDALGGLDALNATRTAPPLALGIALHLGEVMYGNIGARDRLDFTVIGAAVNEASRVEGMCKTLGVPVLLTRAFQGAYPGAATSVGHHALKGVSEPHELFTLPLDVTRAT